MVRSLPSVMSKPEYIIPVQIGDRLDLLVETIGSSGNGIIRHQGYTLFIPGGLPGDRVQLEISKITPRFGVARILERLEDSRTSVTESRWSLNCASSPTA